MLSFAASRPVHTSHSRFDFGFAWQRRRFETAVGDGLTLQEQRRMAGSHDYGGVELAAARQMKFDSARWITIHDHHITVVAHAVANL